MRRSDIATVSGCAILVFLSLASSATAKTSFACDSKPSDPNAAVFRLVDDSTKEEIGTATLIDARRKIAITAMHLMPGGASSGTVSLFKDGKNIKFEIIDRGSSTYILSEDWAIIKLLPKDSQEEMWLSAIPQLNVIYDPPANVDLAGSFVLGGDNIAMSVSISESFVSQSSSAMCSSNQILTIDVNGYRKGHSGSAVYSDKACGVVALSSRFKVPSSASNKGRILDDAVKSLGRLDKSSLSDGVKSSIATIADVTKDVSSRISELEKLSEQRNFVRIVPAKCIVDEFVSRAWKNTSSPSGTIVERQFSDQARMVIQSLREMEKFDDKYMLNLSDKIAKENWNWVDIVQIEAAISRIDPRNLRAPWNGWYEIIKDTHASVRIIERWKLVKLLYAELAYSQNAVVPVIDMAPTFSDLANEFIIRNASTSSAGWPGGLPIMVLGFESALSWSDKIKFANTLNVLLNSDDPAVNSVTPETRKRLADAGIGYFASALASYPNETPIILADSEKVKQQGEILKRLSSAIDTKAAINVTGGAAEVEKMRKLSASLKNVSDPLGYLRNQPGGITYSGVPSVAIVKKNFDLFR